MGGLSGHMMHPYDDLSLTKRDLQSMITNSLNGMIPMSEKVDGFNIHAFKNTKGEVRFARNKKDLQNGGMTIADMIDKWENNPYTLNIYLKSAFLIKKYLNKIDWNDSYFDNISITTLNCECVVGETNIMPYPDARVYIHNTWIWYDDGSYEVIPLNNSMKSVFVENVYFDQKVIIWDTHNSDAIIAGYFEDVEKMFGDCNTIAEYYQMNFLYWLNDNCEWVLHSHEGVKALFNRFFLNDKSVNLKQIKQLYPGREKLVDTLCKQEYKYCLESCTGKLKDFILNVGNTILGNASGYINELNRYEVCQKLSDQLFEAKANLWNYDWRINALEGVVFEWEGKMYKWTGSFAIINKILGEIKYGKSI